MNVLNNALEQNPDNVGADAGSTDHVPYYFGIGELFKSRSVVKRDLALLFQQL